MPFKKKRTKPLARKKLVLIASIVGVLVVLGGGGTLFAVTRSTPEKVLYTALAKDMDVSKGIYGIERSLETTGLQAKSEGYFNPDGRYNADISLTCDASSENGEIAADFTFRQVKADTLFRYDAVTFAGGGDDVLNKQLNDFYKNSVLGKWVLLDDGDSDYLGYQEYGVMFQMLGAYSKKLDTQQILKQFKESGAMTILDVRDIQDGGKPALEYNLLLRKSAYNRFIDSVDSRFRYKDDVLDNFFEDDTTEVTVVVDKATKTVSNTTYSAPNLCVDLLTDMDPDAAATLPGHMTIKATSSAYGTADKLTKPADYITQDELYTIMSE